MQTNTAFVNAHLFTTCARQAELPRRQSSVAEKVIRDEVQRLGGDEAVIEFCFPGAEHSLAFCYAAVQHLVVAGPDSRRVVELRDGASTSVAFLRDATWRLAAAELLPRFHFVVLALVFAWMLGSMLTCGCPAALSSLDLRCFCEVCSDNLSLACDQQHKAGTCPGARRVRRQCTLLG